MELLGDEGVNGNGQTPSDDDTETPDINLTALFEAPDLAQFIKLPKTRVARKYEQKIQAVLKAGLTASLNSDHVPDAAAFLYHGPGIAAAGGTLADQDERTRKVIDLITTPGNPAAMFLLAGTPFIAQLIRNHETELEQARDTARQRRKDARQRRRTGEPKPSKSTPRVSVTIPFIRKTVSVGFRVRFPVKRILSGFRSQTQPPDKLAYHVFSDPKVVAELQKQGIGLRMPE